MISKIEVGASDPVSPLSNVLPRLSNVDPAEFFTTEIASGAIKRKAFNEVSLRLIDLSESDLAWISRLLDAALRPRRNENLAGDKVGQDAPATPTPRRDNKERGRSPKRPNTGRNDFKTAG